MIKTNCKQCGKEIMRRGTNPMVFCGFDCKAEWQRSQKPVGKEWLYQKYIVEKMSANDIAKIVHRDPKRVWEWIRDYGIETRKRGYASTHKFEKGHKSWIEGKHHSPEMRERLRQIALEDGRVPYLQNGVHYQKGKRGEETTNWKGGITPDRQKFYGTPEWKAVYPLVWERDDYTCQRCGKVAKPEDMKKKRFDIHHISGFSNVELRAELSNLILLCERCHYWVHGKENTGKEFMK
jgi:hypothetical protein